MINEIITFLFIFAISALFMLYYGKHEGCFELNFNMNIFAPFLFASFYFLFFCIYAFPGIFTKTICFILFILAIYHCYHYIKCRNFKKVILYHEKIAKIIKRIIDEEKSNGNISDDFANKFKYVIEQCIYYKHYNLIHYNVSGMSVTINDPTGYHPEYHSYDYSRYKFKSYDNIQPKFCDVAYMFRMIQDSYGSISTHSIKLFGSKEYLNAYTEDESRCLEHLKSVTNKMYNDANSAAENIKPYIKTDPDEKWRRISWSDYLKYKKTHPENQNEVNK